MTAVNKKGCSRQSGAYASVMVFPSLPPLLLTMSGFAASFPALPSSLIVDEPFMLRNPNIVSEPSHKRNLNNRSELLISRNPLLLSELTHTRIPLIVSELQTMRIPLYGERA